METAIPESELSLKSENCKVTGGEQERVATLLMVALLGRADHPTDAIQDYCRFLGEGLARRGHTLNLERFAWTEKGWLIALYRLWRTSRDWKRRPILVQYTSLMWSRHGFPLAFLAVLLILRMRNTRPFMVFHDVLPYAGSRTVDRIRQVCQRFVFRQAYRWTEASVVTSPVADVTWLPPTTVKASFIPVGANIPSVVAPERPASIDAPVKTITVFGVTGDGTVGNEVSDIAFVARRVSQAMPGVRLVTFGRGSIEAQPRMQQALNGSPVEYSAFGVLSADEVAEQFTKSDVSLFVRGHISTQRGSAIASIASGVPLVAYALHTLATPLAEAGVVTVPCGDREQLAAATVRLLTDRQMQFELRHASQQAYKKYFSWDAIATSYAELFNHV